MGSNGDLWWNACMSPQVAVSGPSHWWERQGSRKTANHRGVRSRGIQAERTNDVQNAGAMPRQEPRGGASYAAGGYHPTVMRQTAAGRV